MMVVGLGPFAFKVKICKGVENIMIILKSAFTSFLH